MAVICSTYHSTRKFLYHADTKTFTTEVSELGTVPFSQVYDDACDEGFVLVSHKTGHAIVLRLKSTDKSYENEITGWRFEPIKKSNGAGRWTAIDANEFTVLVIND